MQFLTTGQTARLLSCSQQKVIRLCDQGILSCYKMPASTHRRINPSSVIQVASLAGMPVTPELEKLKE